MALLSTLALLISAALLTGALFKRWGMPPMAGEILAGVLLGPALLAMVAPGPALSSAIDIATFFIVFAAGLEMDFHEVMGEFKGRGIWVSLLGFALPFASGYALGAWQNLEPLTSLTLALCVSITALPVMVRILESFKLLKSRLARLCISAAILNDITALVLLGGLLSFHKGESAPAALGSLLLKLAVFGAALFALERGLRLLVRGGRSQRFAGRFGAEALFGICAVFVLAFAAFSEQLKLHAVLGAFFASLLLSPALLGGERFSRMRDEAQSVTAGFFSPLFFAAIGLQFSLAAFESPAFLSLLLLASIASKLAAGWLGGRLAGLKNREAMGVGAMLNGRGIMELVVANVALREGLITPALFSILVLMGIATTLLTPLLFRRTQ